ncbi:hypothetical protein RJT34_21290 [Clitoria ternatea]|uniref:Protein TAR1 n=1 Tax=Clitoria ternatea TaxID=43366 RepID=A0AAN9P5L6_CLITE
MCKCRSHGTFPLFGLQSSHLNICYYHQDLHRRPLRPGSRLGFCSNRRALLLIEAWYLPQRLGIDERFARQYRCGPPPEFPLASPRSGIVHHLSGPDSPGLGHRHNPYRSMSQADWRTGSHRSTSDQDTSPTPIRFPPDNFKHSLTLFSKSFSSFPRGTCSLSVSRPYLALDGIYHPISAAFPNNPTRQQRLVLRQGPGTTGLSPSLAPPSRGLGPGPPLRTFLQTTIWRPKATNFHGGLFPVRSPLLRESLLVSFPPLIDMLKLSGRALNLMASGATCVQRLDGSRDSAIHTKYRISLRSSSMQEPRYPLPRVIHYDSLG